MQEADQTEKTIKLTPYEVASTKIAPVLKALDLPLTDFNVICFACISYFVPYILHQIQDPLKSDFLIKRLTNAPRPKDEDIKEIISSLTMPGAKKNDNPNI